MKNFSSTTAHAASANSKVRNNVFNGMHLRDGKLYSSANGKYPLMSGVDKVSVGTRFNRIFMTDGTTYVYTPDWKLVSFEAQHSVAVGGFYVSSVEELEVNADFQLVKGHRLKVADANGMVVHENVRGLCLSMSVSILSVMRAEAGCFASAVGRLLAADASRRQICRKADGVCFLMNAEKCILICGMRIVMIFCISDVESKDGISGIKKELRYAALFFSTIN